MSWPGKTAPMSADIIANLLCLAAFVVGNYFGEPEPQGRGCVHCSRTIIETPVASHFLWP